MVFCNTLEKATDVAIELSNEFFGEGFFIYKSEEGYTVEKEFRSGWECRGYKGAIEMPLPTKWLWDRTKIKT
jgi:hypothetical protein